MLLLNHYVGEQSPHTSNLRAGKFVEGRQVALGRAVSRDANIPIYVSSIDSTDFDKRPCSNEC